jgi:hypothetical protein
MNGAERADLAALPAITTEGSTRGGVAMKKAPRGSRARRHTPRPTAPGTIAVAGAPWPEPDLREHQRQAVLTRWNAERDLVANAWQDAGAGSVRQQDAEALLQHIDAVRAAIETGMVSAVRLSTLERRLAEFRRAPLVALARRGAKHTGRGFDDVTKVIMNVLAQHPGDATRRSKRSNNGGAVAHRTHAEGGDDERIPA